MGKRNIYINTLFITYIFVESYLESKLQEMISGFQMETFCEMITERENEVSLKHL